MFTMINKLANSFFICVLCLLISCNSPAQDDYVAKREHMVRTQIAARGVKDPETLRAMKKVPRHIFVPSHMVRYAYDDTPLSIGMGQTISQPFMVAYMTEVIEPDADSRVLEIGTGSGYQAAILAEIVKDVYTIEIIPELSMTASRRFKELGYTNIHTRVGDGYNGWPEEAPFDAIIVTAAPENIPAPLTEQLKEGGKMIIPIGSPYEVQQLILGIKKKDELKTRYLFPVRFVPFTRD